jgi:hypothetical protein
MGQTYLKRFVIEFGLYTIVFQKSTYSSLMPPKKLFKIFGIKFSTYYL